MLLVLLMSNIVCLCIKNKKQMSAPELILHLMANLITSEYT